MQGEKNDAECKVIKATINVSESSPMSLLFDSCAQTSTVCNETFLTNIRESEILLIIEGVSEGNTPSTRMIGDLGPFGTVFLCKDIRVSVLSMSAQRNRAKYLKYLFNEDVYRLVCPDGSVHNFKLMNKMYGMMLTNDNMLTKAVTALTTVRKREKNYTKHELTRAKEVMRVSRCLGYEGKTGLHHIIRTGAFVNLGLTHQDVIRAFDIYGPPVPYLKGTSTRRNCPC